VTQCPKESLRVTAALLEALGVPKQVGLSAEVCLARLLDVEAFMRGDANTDRTGRLRQVPSDCSKTGFPATTN
jgi:hypothetical protein